jgi:threonyl-tRNA synthetase
MVMYRSTLHSYRELPLRIAEIAADFRFEASGALTGIERTRAFYQNDSHIFCTPSQIGDVFKEVTKLILDVYNDFGFKNYKFRLSLRDPNDVEKYFGNDDLWEKSESQLRQVLNELGVDYYEAIGEAAFYGPKLDVQVKPAVGNEITVSTCQLDFCLPQKFNLTYVDNDGSKKTPVVIHRAVFGSIDRFIAYYLEETKGNLPLWLAPIGINVIPVNNNYHLDYAKEVVKLLKSNGFRVALDDRDEKLSYKMREAQIKKYPYNLILGQKEVDAGSISYRLHGEEKTTTVDKKEFIKKLKNEIKTKGIK